jgi:hypothetical protein
LRAELTLTPASWATSSMVTLLGLSASRIGFGSAVLRILAMSFADALVSIVVNTLRLGGLQGWGGVPGGRRRGGAWPCQLWRRLAASLPDRAASSWLVRGEWFWSQLLAWYGATVHLGVHAAATLLAVNGPAMADAWRQPGDFGIPVSDATATPGRPRQATRVASRGARLPGATTRVHARPGNCRSHASPSHS